MTKTNHLRHCCVRFLRSHVMTWICTSTLDAVFVDNLFFFKTANGFVQS